ncbi:MAG: hypothetical protein LBR15_10715, partial [Methanobrevibacter sp.]|nr:hypothetical protein [Candidatus Methanovirga australis]
KIIIFTTFEKKIHNFEKGIYFIAYTEVDNVISIDEELYGVFESEIKLELKKLEYFRKPVPAKDLVNELDFIENKDEKYNYSSIEFKDISEDDFKVIFDCGGGLSEKIPLFFQNIPPLTLDLFIEKTIKSVYEIIAKTEKGKVFEIKKFIKILKDILDNYDIKKSDKKSLSYEELLDFYAHNAIKFKFGHLPIREADKSVFLYTSSGKKQKFGYIVLNKQ